ncbi:hypothetical protein [Marinicellulosiphila megalodicopiae]|uniref:hypothetical protein n=1 Tax=Marinicellulosiphila megalodicopiae TaxID=2724896 RepID=UPI003BB203A6
MKNRFIKIKIKFSESTKPIVDIETNGLFIMKSKVYTFISNDKDVNDVVLKDDMDECVFLKKNNGVLIKYNQISLEIINDLFCTIPLYYAKELDGLIVTSNPDLIPSVFKKEIDNAGLWEIILFGTCLWRRTLYEDVSQFPSACRLNITKENIKLKRYWDFNVYENTELLDENKYIKRLDSALLDIFNKIPEGKYLMGVSGGMDSRLSAAYLNKVGKAHMVDTFTYCSTKYSMEYKIAKKVCQNYNLNDNKLYVLTEESYRNTIDFLPKFTCGQIGIQHSHICSILDEYEDNELTQICNYYSDALFGYECSGENNKQSNSLLNILNLNCDLDKIVRKNIEDDIKNIFLLYDPKSNYSSYDEYRYVTERNQKFHINLSFQQSQFLDINLPYANYNLLQLMISIPLKFRKRKKIIDLLFDSGLIEKYNLDDISSKHFIQGNVFANEKIMGLLKKIDFKLQNLLSAMTARLTKGRIIFPNKYHTESHVNVLHFFKKDLISACDKLYDLNVFDEKQREIFKIIPLRSTGVSERFQIISLASLL